MSVSPVSWSAVVKKTLLPSRGHPVEEHPVGRVGDLDRVRAVADVHVEVVVGVAFGVGADRFADQDPAAVGGDVEAGDRAGHRRPVRQGRDDLGRARVQVAVVDRQVAFGGGVLEFRGRAEDEVAAVVGERLADVAGGFGARFRDRALQPLNEAAVRHDARGSRSTRPRSRGRRGCRCRRRRR